MFYTKIFLKSIDKYQVFDFIGVITLWPNILYHRIDWWNLIIQGSQYVPFWLIWYNQYLTLSKVPDEKVKEITEYSQEMLKKMEKARIDANYNEVC